MGMILVRRGVAAATQAKYRAVLAEAAREVIGEWDQNCSGPSYTRNADGFEFWIPGNGDVHLTTGVIAEIMAYLPSGMAARDVTDGIPEGFTRVQEALGG